MLKSILLIIFIVVSINCNLFSQSTFLKYGSVKSIGNKVDGNYIEYYDNNQISLKGSFINSKKNGQWLQYDEKGNLEENVNYKDDLLNGECNYFDEQNQIYKTNFTDGWLNGEYYYNINGINGGTTIGYFNMGVPNGKFICYIGDTITNIKNNATKKKPQDDLTWISYHINKLEQCNFNDKALNYFADNVRKQIIYKANFVNGVLENQYYSDLIPDPLESLLGEFGVRHLSIIALSSFFNYHSVSSGKYVNGKKTGKWILFVENEGQGLMKFDLNYTDGKINGKCVVYSNDCKVFCNVNIINGVRDDIWVYNNTYNQGRFNAQKLDQLLGIELSESAKQKDAEVDAAAKKKRFDIEEENKKNEVKK